MTKPRTSQPRDNWKLMPKRVLVGALIVDAFFAVMYSLTIWLPQTPSAKPLTFLFDMNGEGNVAAWWQGSQLLLIGLAFFALTLWFFQSDERVGPLRRLFFVSGLAFTYFSADEIGQVHENTSKLLQSWHALNLAEIRLLAALGHKMHKLHGGSLWIPLFAIIGIALIWWLWPQFRLAWSLWHREILLLVIGFGVLVFAATVIESMGDLIPKSMYALRLIEVGVEETLESLGSSIVLYSVVRVLARAGERVLPGSTSPMSVSPPAEGSPAE
ncbi:MAG: hypothetical protein P4L93_05000 [Coriobacteriia bacterium]|nr:hypothetical protein [Coriobacteriia bacterium]